VTIRQYKQSDRASILAIYAETKLDELQFENSEFELLPLEQDLQRSAQIFQADIFVYGCDDIVAFCAYSGKEIRALFVHRNARGKGIGKKLLTFMLARINDNATLYVAASNYPAISLYQYYGFETITQFSTTYNNVTVIAQQMKQPLVQKVVNISLLLPLHCY